MIGIIAGGIASLVAVQAITTLAGWLALVVTAGRPRLRALFGFAILGAYHAVLYPLLPQSTVHRMDILFFWLHLGFTCRHLSAMYYHRGGGGAPALGFHFGVVLFGPGQHYGAGNWDELKGRSFDRRLLREWLLHMLYGAVIVAMAAAVIGAVWPREFPLQRLVLIGAFGIIGLQVLNFCGDLQFMAWAFRGYHRGFFGNFAWLKSVHLGQFWRNWNVQAVRAFGELTTLLQLRRRPFVNTMTVFVASGLLHQLTIFYYVRRPCYGTMIAFLLHGLLVYLFGRLYHARKRLPAPLRAVVFNQVTTLIVAIAVSSPLALDFYGVFSV